MTTANFEYSSKSSDFEGEDLPLQLLHKSFTGFCLEIESQESIEIFPNSVERDLAELIHEILKAKTHQLIDILPKLSEYLVNTTISYASSGNTQVLMVYSSSHVCTVLAFNKKSVQTAVNHCEKLLTRSRVSHCLVVVLEPFLQLLQLLAAVYDYDQETSQVLTEHLEYSVDFMSGLQEKVLHDFVKALRTLRNFCHDYKPEEFIDVTVPWPLAEWKNLKRLGPELVYLGDHCGLQLVGKFSKHYSTEAHAAWQQENLAPRLYSVSDVGEDWKLIVMEFLSPDEGWTPADKYIKRHPWPQTLSTLKKALMDCLTKAHKTGYVHGDFRAHNVFLRVKEQNFEFRAIDFEWSGLAGVARYPAEPNRSIVWPEGAGKGQPIEKEHDTWFARHFEKTDLSLVVHT